MRATRTTASVAAVLTFGLIVLGALVRSTNSGLSCPDWPTCYGHWVLTPSQFAAIPGTGYEYYQVMLEWTHRLIAGVFLGPLILLLAVLAFLGRKERPRIAIGAGVLLVLLVIQGSLGRFTVLDQNSPWSVAAHLGTALLVLTAIIYIRVRSGDEWHDTAPLVGGLACLAWACALTAMLAAAVTSKSGAALACSTWPLCDGKVVPDLADPLVRVHFAHRVLAGTTGVLILLTALAAARTAYRWHTALALFLVGCQVVLGALVIVWQVPTSTAVLHQAMGVLTFAVLTALVWRALKPRTRQRRAPTIGESTHHGLAVRGA